MATVVLTTEQKWAVDVKILGAQLGWQPKDCRTFYQIQLFDIDVDERWLRWFSKFPPNRPATEIEFQTI